MASSHEVLPYSIDDLFELSSLGSLNKQIGNNLFGINRSMSTSGVPAPRNHQGLVFFTRPQLNLSNFNVMNVRQLYPLLTTDPISLQRALRILLDPRLGVGYGNGLDAVPGLQCPLVNNEMAYIPILTNNLMTLSGWPDLVFPSFTAKEGLYKQSYMQIDGTAKIANPVDFSATFRNSAGDPILNLFYIWGLYTTLVFEGLLVPYPDFITENEIEYNTRAFRLILDPTGKRVEKIAATGPGLIEAVGIGSGFDFSRGADYNESQKEHSIRFKFSGVEYNDPILIYEFNQITNIFKPAMEDGVRENSMVRIDNLNTDLFNDRGYPRIDPKTYDLEYWVEKEYAEAKLTAFKAAGLIE